MKILSQRGITYNRLGRCVTGTEFASCWDFKQSRKTKPFRQRCGGWCGGGAEGKTDKEPEREGQRQGEKEREEE